MDEQAQVEDTGPVYHHTTQNARGTQDVCVTLTADADQREKKVICAPQWVIPIILLPGVIGTNLKEKNKSHEVWRAPNSTLAGLPMLMEFFFKGAAARHKTWGEVLWTGQVPPGAILDTATLTQDDLDSSIELAGALKLTLEAAKLDGDGTVPALSGLAPQGKALSMFVHGQGTVPGNASLDAMRTPDLQAPARQEGYDHQDSYLDKRGQWTTLYAIAKIAQKADWAQP